MQKRQRSTQGTTQRVAELRRLAGLTRETAARGREIACRIRERADLLRRKAKELRDARSVGKKHQH